MPQRSASLPPESQAGGVLALVAKVQRILASRGLTMYRAAALTRERYPKKANYWIRSNFYFQLRSGLSPTLQQLFALSEVTGYRLRDWFAIFDLRLDAIPRLQVVLVRPGTALIDDRLDDEANPLLSVRFRRRAGASPSIIPLSQLLEGAGESLALPRSRSDFLYVKIGAKDTLAAPQLAVGSVVRADSQQMKSFLPHTAGKYSSHFFLVEQRRRLICARLRLVAPNRFALGRTELFPNVEFEPGKHAGILGVVDLEFRFPVAVGKEGETASSSTQPFPASSKESGSPQLRSTQPGMLLRNSRIAAGLSFRGASRLSRNIAESLGDKRYFASAGTLSDYEAGHRLPRHLHKLFTLAILYSVGWKELLRSFDVAWEDDGKDRIPDTLGAVRTARAENGENGQSTESFWQGLLRQFADLPFFLRKALPALTGLKQIGFRDLFCVAGQANPLHPALKGALLLLINRRVKKPRKNSSLSLWAQPLYLLQTRTGAYLCGSSVIEDGRLVLYEYSDDPSHAQQVRHVVDGEVVGQIVAIMRSLISPP